jgi:hypothetical protein
VEIFKCSCGEVFFADAVQETACLKCGKTNKFPMYIKTKRYNVPVHQRTKLYACHTIEDSLDYATLTAEVTQKSDGFELKNVSDKAWIVSNNGKQLPVTPGSAIILNKSSTFDFGETKAEVI